MKHFKHPATIIAAVALFAALSGGAGAAMTAMISGSQIKNGSIPVNKLSESAIKSLQVTRMVGNDNTGECALNTTESSPTFCGRALTFDFDKKTAVLVTASLDLASTNGLKNGAAVGICYAKHGSNIVTRVNHVYPEFAAAADSYFAQGVSGTIGGLKGTYDVGLCLEQ